jgi:membrane protease YdiL (CAAX protease family)
MTDHVPPRPDLPVPAGWTPPPAPGAEAPERPRATWSWWEAILVYVLVLVISLFVTAPIVALIHAKGLADLTASAAIAAINVVLLVLWLRRFHPRWKDIIGFPRRLLPEALRGARFGVGLYVGIVFVVGLILTVLLQVITGHGVRSPRQIPVHLSAVGVTVSIAYGVFIAPIHEELFFRGILFRSLADRYGFVIGAVGSGLAFGLIHYVPAAWYDSVLLMGVMVVTGVALSWFYDRRGNIVASIVAHATFNVIGLTLIFALR